MATLASIKKQIADLQKRAEALIKAESKDAVAKIRSMIEKYQLTAEDLGFMTGSVSQEAKPAKAARAGKRAAGARKKSAAKSVGVAMYQDPKSGKTWTGRGKPPNWLAGVKDRSAFLIGATAVPAPAAEPLSTKTKKAGKVAGKAKAAAAPVEAPVKAARKGPGKKAAAPVRPAKGAKPVKARAAGKKASSKKTVNGAPMPASASFDAGQEAQAS